MWHTHINFADSLIEARMKANKAKNTSDLSSADDQITARKTRFRSSVVLDPPNYNKNSDEDNSDSTGRWHRRIVNNVRFLFLIYIYLFSVDDEDRDPMYSNDGENNSKFLFSVDDEELLCDPMMSNDSKNNCKYLFLSYVWNTKFRFIILLMLYSIPIYIIIYDAIINCYNLNSMRFCLQFHWVHLVRLTYAV